MKVLRPYQQAAIDATLDRLRSSGSTVVVLPTGCGKTVYASRLISGWERGNTLFLAHTRELIEQAADKLSGELGYKPPIEMNVRTVETDTIFSGDMCVVGSVQTMYSDRRLEKYRDHPFGLIVIDESHHATASTYRKIIDYFRALNPSLKVVGITATPNRADGAALGTVFESEAYQMSILDAVNDGWLVPVEQEYVVCDEINYDGIKTKRNEFGEADFSAESLEEVMAEEGPLHQIALPLLDKAGDRQGLVFTPGVRSAHMLAAILNRYRDGCAKAVDGKTEKQDRERIVAEFNGGRLQFLLNCMVFTEGFDSPRCSLIGMGRPTKSLSMYMQMLGRGLRPLPGIVDGVPEAFDRRMGIQTSDKPLCKVLDFVGNSSHKLANVFDVLGGTYDAEVRDLAAGEARRTQKPVGELLEQAAAIRDLRNLFKKREHVRARASYESWAVDPFGHGPAPSVGETAKGRGGCSDAQIGLLVKLGVSRETAAGYTKRQAGAVIDSLGKTKCTAKQAAALQRAGVNPAGIGLDRAGRILDALAQNNWQPLGELPA